MTPATPQSTVGEPASVRQKLKTWFRVLKAEVQRNTSALEDHNRRLLEERNVEVVTASSIEATEDMKEKKPWADEDSAKINLLGSYRRDY